MNEKKQPQDEVALDENEQSDRRKIETCLSASVRLPTPANDYIGRKEYQKEISLWNDEESRQEFLNGDLSMIKIISISAVTSFIVTFIILLIN